MVPMAMAAVVAAPVKTLSYVQKKGGEWRRLGEEEEQLGFGHLLGFKGD
jgi:hypothetical protein